MVQKNNVEGIKQYGYSEYHRKSFKLKKWNIRILYNDFNHSSYILSNGNLNL